MLRVQFPPKKSRLTRFLLIQGGVLLLGASLIGVGGGVFLRFMLKEVWKAQFHAEARALYFSLTDFLRERSQLLTDISQDPDFTANKKSRLSLVFKHYGRLFQKLEYIDSQGRRFLSRRLAQDDELFAQALKHPNLVTFGEASEEEKTNKQVRLMICQFEDQKNPQGCLEAHLRLNLRKFILRRQFLSHFRVDLYNRKTKEPSVEIFPYQSRQLRAIALKEAFNFAKGQESFNSDSSGLGFFEISSLPETPWNVMISAPRDVFKQETQNLERGFWALLVVSSLFIFLFSFEYLRRRIYIPSSEIESYALKISKELGAKSVNVDSKLGPEIGFLRSFFEQLYQDVCQFKETEKNYQQKLKDEVERTSQKLIQAEKLAVTSQLMAGVAHEIRNPLTSMALAVENLIIKTNGKEKHTEEKYLTMLRNDISRLSDILDSFLKVTRPLKVQFRRSSINEIIKNAIRIIEPECKEKGIQIDCKLGDSIEPMDLLEDEVTSGIVNLLRNAMEAVGKNGSIRVISHQNQRRVQIRVEDSGPGIPKDIRDRIFDIFFTTKEDGTGLGLAQVMQTAKIHKGDISIDQSDLGGAKFEIEFPI